ncbi:MAG: GH1 family beta-glucosidase [Planctomycetota bacterium]
MLHLIRQDFGSDFVWGAATSAYQIEGSPRAHGAGPSNWHEFAHVEGRIEGGHHGDVACDHYRRSSEDVHLMSDLGIQAYRFSVSWSRIMPAGTGRVNPSGIDFYQRLVDDLLAAGIQPYLTLFHWDLPASLEHRGGWLHPQSPRWFADYAEVVARALGDRVSHWCTLNEPWVIANHGYVEGIHPPGKQDVHAFCRAVHHLLLAHQEATAALRAANVPQVSVAVNLTPQHPQTDSNADVQAATYRHAYVNRLFLDPLFRGQYPTELRRCFGRASDVWREDQLDCERGGIDCLGINYYLRNVVAFDPHGLVKAREVQLPGVARTSMGWEVYPEGLQEILLWVRATYGDLPLLITENGAAFEDEQLEQDLVIDQDRIRYLQQHLIAVAAAIRAGINLRGYFVWSLMDNFEWSCGYSKRFGIVRVDPSTQQRHPKASAHFYRDWIQDADASRVLR